MSFCFHFGQLMGKVTKTLEKNNSRYYFYNCSDRHFPQLKVFAESQINSTALISKYTPYIFQNPLLS